MTAVATNCACWTNGPDCCRNRQKTYLVPSVFMDPAPDIMARRPLQDAIEELIRVLKEAKLNG